MRDDSGMASIIREIRRAKICEPVDGEFVDQCHYSRTGWAIWRRDDDTGNPFCTCQPAKAPRDA